MIAVHISFPLTITLLCVFRCSDKLDTLANENNHCDFWLARVFCRLTEHLWNISMGKSVKDKISEIRMYRPQQHTVKAHPPAPCSTFNAKLTLVLASCHCVPARRPNVMTRLRTIVTKATFVRIGAMR